MKTIIMQPEQVAKSLAIPDLSDPKNGIHAINLVLYRLSKFFTNRVNYPTPTIYRSSPITTTKECFDDLMFPTDAVVRSSRHTLYVAKDKILRPHTSSMIPQFFPKIINEEISDALIFCPSICFRSIRRADRMHIGEPHQLDIWHIRKSPISIGKESLLKLIDGVAHCVIPKQDYRVVSITKGAEKSHPYLSEAYKGRVKYGNEDVGFLEGGIVNPTLFTNMGALANTYSGVCVGIMLERAVMLIKKLDDVRLLQSTDVRVQKQMKNLDLYVPVSKYPSIKRDFSFVAGEFTTVEDYRRAVCEAVGDGVEIIEDISTVFEVSYEALPEGARKRLGIIPGQKNVLLRVTFRSLDHTLQNDEILSSFNKIHKALCTH